MNKINIVKSFDQKREKGGEPESQNQLLINFGSRDANSSNNLFKYSTRKNGSGIVEEMTSLYLTITALLPDSKSRIIQFIGSNEGEGTTTITRGLAGVITEKFGKSVRIVDTEMQKTGQLLYFDLKFEAKTKKPIREHSGAGKKNDQALRPNMLVKSFSKKNSLYDESPNLLGNSDILENMRDEIDFIFVDSIAANISSSDLVISNKVDGVVLVVEAERTRWKVAESLKDKIIKHGGNILGVVLNKQRHYIPDVIYRNL